MAKPPFIELANGLKIPILHEDRNVIAIDKPQGWMLAPVSWQNTGRNLFAALTSSVSAGDFWARSRNLKFIRFVHRLDADTSGVLLLVKAPGAVPAYTELFEDRKVQKVYLAVVRGVPEVVEWRCRLRIAPMQERAGLMEINNAVGKDSETLFRVIDKRADRALLMCWPLTGRTHQIRLHLAAVGHPVWGDELYGKVPTTKEEKTDLKLALRSVRMSYKDPFLAEPVDIQAEAGAFAKLHGFDPSNAALSRMVAPEKALEHPKARLEETRRAEKESRKQQRDEVRAAHPTQGRPGAPSRGDWSQDEDNGGFAAQPARRAEDRAFPPRTRRAPQNFERAPRPHSGFGDRPPRPSGQGRPFGGPRKFEDRRERPSRPFSGGGYSDSRQREGGFPRRPYGERQPDPRQRAGSYSDRPPGRPGFGRRPYGGQADSPADRRPGPFGARPGGFRGRPGGKPAFDRPYEERGERRTFSKGGGFDRGPRSGEARGERPQTRAGVFQSSAKPGFKAGFRSAGFGPRSDARPFRAPTAERRPQGRFGGPGGSARGQGGRKYGEGNRPQRRSGHGAR